MSTDRDNDLVTRLVADLHEARDQLATVTAERDELKAELLARWDALNKSLAETRAVEAERDRLLAESKSDLREAGKDLTQAAETEVELTDKLTVARTALEAIAEYGTDWTVGMAQNIVNLQAIADRALSSLGVPPANWSLHGSLKDGTPGTPGKGTP